MKFLWIFFIVMGIWSLASAATANGLFPSGHGAGRFSEAAIGLVLIGYSIFRLKRSQGLAR